MVKLDVLKFYLFLIFGNFEPRCSYEIVLIKKSIFLFIVPNDEAQFFNFLGKIFCRRENNSFGTHNINLRSFPKMNNHFFIRTSVFQHNLIGAKLFSKWLKFCLASARLGLSQYASKVLLFSGSCSSNLKGEQVRLVNKLYRI